MFNWLFIFIYYNIFVRKIKPFDVDNNCRADEEIRTRASEQVEIFVGAILVIQTCSTTLIDIASKGYFYSFLSLGILGLTYVAVAAIVVIIVSVETGNATYVVVTLLGALIAPMVGLVIFGIALTI